MSAQGSLRFNVFYFLSGFTIAFNPFTNFFSDIKTGNGFNTLRAPSKLNVLSAPSGGVSSSKEYALLFDCDG